MQLITAALRHHIRVDNAKKNRCEQFCAQRFFVYSDFFFTAAWPANDRNRSQARPRATLLEAISHADSVPWAVFTGEQELFFIPTITLFGFVVQIDPFDKHGQLFVPGVVHA